MLKVIRTESGTVITRIDGNSIFHEIDDRCDCVGIYLTADEARQLSAHLLEVARELEETAGKGRVK